MIYIYIYIIQKIPFFINNRGTPSGMKYMKFLDIFSILIIKKNTKVVNVLHVGFKQIL